MSFSVYEALQDLECKNDYELADKFRIHPSSATYCPRNQVLRSAGIKTCNDVSRELMFCIANHAHNMISRLLNTDGIYTDIEQSFENEEYLLSGKPDVILSGPRVQELDGVDKIIVDIKTKPFVSRKTVINESEELQVQLYMFITGIRKATILYVSRVNGANMIVDVPYSQVVVDDYLKRLDGIFDTLDSGELPDPDRECSTECWYIEYCESLFKDKMRRIVLDSYNSSKTDAFTKRRCIE